jgi:hypothetical protein
VPTEIFMIDDRKTIFGQRLKILQATTEFFWAIFNFFLVARLMVKD